MKRFDPRRADSRPAHEKLAHLIMALPHTDLVLAQRMIDDIAKGRPDSRAAFVRLVRKDTSEAA